MNKLILCEGETDAILLSYYLGRVSGWQYSKKGPSGLEIRATSHNESVNWYWKGNDYLLICAVGGKDNFGRFYNEKIKTPLLETNAFGRISIVTDRDNREISDIEVSAAAALKMPHTEMKNNQWVNCNYTDSFGMKKTLEALLVVIPNEQQGALETAMLAAISENEYDRNIVEKTRIFSNQMRTEASRLSRLTGWN